MNIVDEIEVTLTPQQSEALADARSADPEAMDVALRATYHFNRFGRSDLLKARDLYEKAIEIDPGFAAAYSGLAASYFALAAFDQPPAIELTPRVRAAALKALELDENEPGAHLALASAHLFLEWNWPEAEKELLLALALNPNSALAHHVYADYLTVMGRVDEGILDVERTRELDPLSPATFLPVSAHLLMARRFDEVVEECDTLIALDPDSVSALIRRGDANWSLENREQALADYVRVWEIQGEDDLIEAVRRDGDDHDPRSAMLEVARAMEARPQEDQVAMRIAETYARIGKVDHAFLWLEKAFEEHATLLIFLEVQPQWDLLRSDPRYDELARRIGLPE